ncbi:hypothetical protein [Fimbriiglobus ruber]|uniref:Uncharacterized protein n=1 Tax=Fimbriiglobus ruber TaxID=1908690 RepID=A0A225D4F6_9BACT|nr:hypothetical protein [Fimbriiglobus ruber]OWK36372.1 hypothetical protein FRUB_08935 [Fimbriiglobus ruber]
MSEGIKGKIEDAGHAAAEAAKKVGHKVAGGVEQAADWVKEKAHKVGEKAGQATEKAGDAVETAGQHIKDKSGI